MTKPRSNIKTYTERTPGPDRPPHQALHLKHVFLPSEFPDQETTTATGLPGPQFCQIFPFIWQTILNKDIS
jgi:hypothetical protein